MADFTDSFDGSGPPDSAHWATFVGAAERSGGALVPTEAPYAAALTAPTLGADQWVEAEIASVANEVGIIVRSPVAGSGYALWGNPAGGPLLEGYFISRFASGVSTDLAQVSTTGPVPGDVPGLRIVGSTLQATLNGQDLGDPVTDTTYTGPGQAGVALIGAGDSIAWFRARDVVSPTPVSAATNVPAESIARRTAAGTTGDESLSAPARASSTPHESCSFATRAVPASVEWIARPTRAAAVAVEQLGRITRDALSPREHIARAAAAWASPSAWQRDLTASGASGQEWVALVALAAPPAALEVLARVRLAADAPWESGGHAGVTQSIVAPWESVTAVLTTRLAPWERTRSLTVPAASARESLAPSTRTTTVSTELLGRASFLTPTPWESNGLQAVTLARSAPWESLGRSVVQRPAPVEALARVIVVDLAVWEMIRGRSTLASLATTPHEVLRGVLAASPSAFAWLGRIASALAAAWEALGVEPSETVMVRLGEGYWLELAVEGQQLSVTIRGEWADPVLSGHDVTPPVIGAARDLATIT